MNRNDLYEDDARVFKALCDGKRLQILECLRDGNKCACVLSDMTGIKQTALSYHMKILCESNIVKSAQEGKLVIYSFSDTGIEYAKNLLDKLTTKNNDQIENSYYFDKLEN